MNIGRTFFNLTKEGGLYSCNQCLEEINSSNSGADKHSFRWRDLDIMPVGYKGNYRIYLTCEKCDNIISVPENIIPRWRLFKLKLKLGLF